MTTKHHAHVFTSLASYLSYCTGSSKLAQGAREEQGSKLAQGAREEQGSKLSEQEKEQLSRWASVRWKQHIEKHGNVPLIIQCGVCSGREVKDAIKHGAYKPDRKSKTIRDEEKTEVLFPEKEEKE